MIRTFATFVVLAASVFILTACHHFRANIHGAQASLTPVEGDHDHGRTAVSELNVAMPIAPGKTVAWQQALADLVGPRYTEYEASRRRYGLTSQTTFLQKTRMGDFAVIHLTGPDVHKSLHAMSESMDPWDVSWRELTLNLHGVDFAKGVKVFPKIEPLFSMDSGNITNTRPFMFVAPVTPQGGLALRTMASELMGKRHAEYQAARVRIGVQRESVFLQSSEAGDAVVFYWLAADPQTSLKRLMASTSVFDEWLRAAAREAHPIALEVLLGTVRENTLVADYPRR